MDSFLFTLIDDFRYLGVFLLMVGETVFPPIPSEVILPLAGVRAGQGDLSLWGVILAGSLGAMVGNFFWYVLARMLGLPRLRLFLRNHGRWLTLRWHDITWAQRLFQRYGTTFVFLGRMVPTLRSLVSLPAGIIAMPLTPFLIWSTLGTIGWSTLLTLAGFFLGQEFHQIDRLLGPLSSLVLFGILAVYAWRQWRWNKTAPTSQIPPTSS